MSCILNNKANNEIAKRLNVDFSSYVAIINKIELDEEGFRDKIADMEEKEAASLIRKKFFEEKTYGIENEENYNAVLEIYENLKKSEDSLDKDTVRKLNRLAPGVTFSYTTHNGEAAVHLFKPVKTNILEEGEYDDLLNSSSNINKAIDKLYYIDNIITIDEYNSLLEFFTSSRKVKKETVARIKQYKERHKKRLAEKEDKPTSFTSKPTSFNIQNGNIILNVDAKREQIDEDILAYTYKDSLTFGSIFSIDPDDYTANDLVKLIKIMNKQKDKLIYQYISDDEAWNKLSEEYQNILQEHGIYQIPKYIFGFTRADQEIRKQTDVLLSSTEITMSTLRDYGRSAIAELNKYLNELKSDPEANEKYFGEDYKNEDFVGNTTEEILNKVGVEKVFSLIKERVFNPGVNYISKRRAGDAQYAIYNNWNGFLNLCYDQILNTLGIVLLNTDNIAYVSPEIEAQGDAQDAEDLDEQAMAEEYGSSQEYFQFNFRSVSPHKSLSKDIISRLTNFYELDEDGNIKHNALKLPKYIDAHDAVSQILLMTRNSDSVDEKDENGKYTSTSMVGKLQKYVKAHPWLNQLVREYKLSEESDVLIKGDLVNDAPKFETFKSLFYTNFQKYFQKYNTLFIDPFARSARLRTLNVSTFTEYTLDQLKERSYNKEKGALSVYDAEEGEYKTEECKRLYEELEEDFRLYMNVFEGPNVTISDKSISALYQVYDLLDIDNSSYEVFAALFTHIKPAEYSKLLDATSRILTTIIKNANDPNFKFYAKLRASIRVLAEFISPIMSMELESTFHEDGKSYYSYVLPSYLNKLITKLSGRGFSSQEEYDAFMEKEYKQYTGWFYDPEYEIDLFDRGRYMVPWLQDITDYPDVRNALDHAVLLTADGVGYVDKTPAEYIASIIANYFYNRSSRFAYFRVGTLSE